MIKIVILGAGKEEEFMVGVSIEYIPASYFWPQRRLQTSFLRYTLQISQAKLLRHRFGQLGHLCWIKGCASNQIPVNSPLVYLLGCGELKSLLLFLCPIIEIENN